MDRPQDFTRAQIITHLHYIQYLRNTIDYNLLPVPGKISYKRPYSSPAVTALSHIHFLNIKYLNNMNQQLYGRIILSGNE